MSTAPILVFTFGNPSRGDDALGPEVYEQLTQLKQTTSDMDTVDLLTDFQLQIEHSVDIEHRECIVFIDASMSCAPPYEFRKIQPEQDDSYTTHAMTPAAVLAVYQQVNQQAPPPTYLLSIRGYEFDLGHALSRQAEINLSKALEFINHILKSDIGSWENQVQQLKYG